MSYFTEFLKNYGYWEPVYISTSALHVNEFFFKNNVPQGMNIFS